MFQRSWSAKSLVSIIKTFKWRLTIHFRMKTMFFFYVFNIYTSKLLFRFSKNHALPNKSIHLLMTTTHALLSEDYCMTISTTLYLFQQKRHGHCYQQFSKDCNKPLDNEQAQPINIYHGKFQSQKRELKHDMIRLSVWRHKPHGHDVVKAYK